MKKMRDAETTSTQFHAILKEMAELHERKAYDYGSEGDSLDNIRAAAELGIAPWKGALLRLNDKVHRLRRFAMRGDLKNESAEDSMRDVAVYAVIMLILYKEEARRPKK